MTTIQLVVDRFAKWLMTLLMLCIVVPVSAGTDVYVTRDEDGNPVFSDQPSDAAEKIRVDEIMTIPATEVRPESRQGEKKSFAYEKLFISHPLHDSALRENSGKVTISVKVKPALRGGDQLVIQMDGKEVSRGSGTSVSLENVDRGTHQVSASIISADGSPVLSADSVTFSLLRFNQ